MDEDESVGGLTPTLLFDDIESDENTASYDLESSENPDLKRRNVLTIKNMIKIEAEKQGNKKTIFPSRSVLR
jgi:hypothetical protein